VEITVEVTAKDIERGMPRQSCECPVALALGRAVRKQVAPRPLQITVGCLQAIMSVDGWWVEALLPSDASAFINSFDHNEPVAPFTFKIEVPV
jgi:hypothetical protein